MLSKTITQLVKQSLCASLTCWLAASTRNLWNSLHCFHPPTHRHCPAGRPLLCPPAGTLSPALLSTAFSLSSAATFPAASGTGWAPPPLETCASASMPLLSATFMSNPHLPSFSLKLFPPVPWHRLCYKSPSFLQPL